jgi:hypothetical protein
LLKVYIMSKRKNRSASPNIPQATLDRARQQISGDAPLEPVEAVEEAAAEAKVESVTLTNPPPRPAARISASSSRTRGTRRTQPAQAKGGRKEAMGTDIVRNRLLHPTRVVTENQLREEYGYVMRDLRMIGLISIAMIVLMIVVAQIV